MERGSNAIKKAFQWSMEAMKLERHAMYQSECSELAKYDQRNSMKTDVMKNTVMKNDDIISTLKRELAEVRVFTFFLSFQLRFLPRLWCWRVMVIVVEIKIYGGRA
jgi:hypothetical protein